MPRPLVHFAIPLSLLSLFTGLDLWTVVFLSVVACLPDLDVPSRVHRSPTYGLIVLVISCVLATLLVWKTCSDSKSLNLVGLSSLVLFAGFRPLLWPLVNRSFYLEASLSIPSFYLHSSTTLFPEFPPTPELGLSALITPQGVVLSSILFASALAIWVFNTKLWKVSSPP